MARSIVKDYIDYDKKNIREYIDIITEKKLSNKICDMIIETYINVRYFDMYEHVKDYPIYNVEYYVTEKFKKQFDDKNKEKNIPLVVDVLIVLRYVFLYEKFCKDNGSINQLEGYEDKLKKKFGNTKNTITNLIKLIKDNTHKKEKYLNGLLSNDFSVIKKETNIKKLYDMVFDNSVKIPDLFSEVAIDRVYNSGIIYEDRMQVFYLLSTREILVDLENFVYDNQYLVEFPTSLINKRNKLSALLKIIDSDYLRDRIILKIRYSEYLEKKDDYDKLIHEGYSLAVIIDEDISDSKTLLNIFAYIIVSDDVLMKELKEFDNLVLLK